MLDSGAYRNSFPADVELPNQMPTDPPIPVTTFSGERIYSSWKARLEAPYFKGADRGIAYGYDGQIVSLISIPEIVDSGFQVLLTRTHAIIIDEHTRKAVSTGYRNNNGFWLIELPH